MKKEKPTAETNRLDPREVAAYPLFEAAHYLRLPAATLRSWVKGRYYETDSGPRFFSPVIKLPDPDLLSLSFVNLVEAHVLAALRRQHGIPLRDVRLAVNYLKRHFHQPRPLADHPLETDGLDLFVERFGSLVTATKGGQLALRDVLQAHLIRIDRDPSTNVAVRLYPFTRSRAIEAPRFVVIDPRVSFGRPVLTGTGIPTSAIADRYKAGDSIDLLVDDYGRARQEIEEAIRCELQIEAA